MSPILALCTVALFATVSCLDAPEKALANHLLDTYEELGVYGRPVTDVKDPVKVQLGLSLTKILRLEKGYVTVAGWMSLQWEDPFLAWDPKDFGGAEKVILPSDEIWTPDISVWNDYHQSSSDQEEDMEDTNVLIKNDGKVVWVPRMTYKTSCVEDAKVKGQVSCSFLAGSWAHAADELEVDIDAKDDGNGDIDVENLEATPGVELVSHSATVENKEFECCPGEKYTIVTYNIVVKRTHSNKSNDEL